MNDDAQWTTPDIQLPLECVSCHSVIRIKNGGQAPKECPVCRSTMGWYPGDGTGPKINIPQETEAHDGY